MSQWDSVRRKRVLVVDDDRAIVELIAMRLDLMGYEAVSAYHGMQALSRISDVRPAAMILDINMPTLDGFGVLTKLGLERARQLPTIVLTARNKAEDVRMAISLGARDFLAKPFDQMQLMARLSRLMRNGEGPRPAIGQAGLR